MADVDLTGRVRIQSDGSVRSSLNDMANLNGSVGELDRRLKGSANATSNATKSFAKMAQGLGGLVQAYAFVAANVFALSAAFNSLREAARAEQLTQSMQAFATATGVAATTIVGNLKEITDYALSTQDAMRITAQATASGFSGAQIERITKVAADASKALGRDMGDSVDRLIRGVSKLEPELIDEIGLMTRVDEAARDYALSIGKSASSLTSFEKRMAFANAVIAEGEAKFGMLGDQVPANTFDKMAAQINDLLKKVIKPIADVVGTIGNTLLRNIEVVAVVGFLVLVNSIDKLSETVTAKAEARLAQAEKEAARTEALLNKAADARAKKIVAADPATTALTIEKTKASQQYTKTVEDVLSSTGTRGLPMRLKQSVQGNELFNKALGTTSITELEDIVKQANDARKVASELIKTERQNPLGPDAAAIQTARDMRKEYTIILDLAKKKLKVSELDSDLQEKIVQEITNQRAAVQSTIDAAKKRSDLAAASLDIAQTTEAGGVTGGLREGFGRLKDLLKGTAQASGSTPEDIARQESINASVSSMGRLERAGFALNEGFSIVEQVIGGVVGTIGRLTNIIGYLTIAYTFAKEGWNAWMTAIGAKSEELDKAAESSENLTKQIEELAKTQKYYDSLLSKGYAGEAFKQRATTLQSLVQVTQETASDYVKALQKMESEERRIAKEGGTFLDFIGEELLGRRTAARNEAVSDYLTSAQEGVNSLLQRLKPQEVQAFGDALRSALGPELAVNINASTKEVYISEESFNQLAKRLGSTAAAAQLLNTALSQAGIAGSAAAAELSEAFGELNSSIKQFTDNTAKSYLANVNVSPELQVAFDAKKVQENLGRVLNAVSSSIAEGTPEASIATQKAVEEALRLNPEKLKEIAGGNKEQLDLIAKFEANQATLRANTIKQSILTSIEAAQKELKDSGVKLRRAGVDTQTLEATPLSTAGRGARPYEGETLALVENRNKQVKIITDGLEALGLTAVGTLDRVSSATTGVAEDISTSNIQALKVTQELASNTGISTVIQTTIDGYIDVANKTEAAKVATTQYATEVERLKQKSDESVSGLVKLSKAEENLAKSQTGVIDAQISKLVEFQKKAQEKKDYVGEAAIQQNLNQAIADREQAELKVQEAKRKTLFYTALEQVDLDNIKSSNEGIQLILKDYPELYSLASPILEQNLRLTELQNQAVLEGLDAQKNVLTAQIELRKTLQGDFFENSTTISELKNIQALTREITLKPLKDEIASIQQQRLNLSGQTDTASIARVRELNQQEANLEQQRRNQEVALNIQDQREVAEQLLKEIEQRNKFVVNFKSATEFSDQVFFSIGQRFRRDIEDSMGIVEGTADVFSSALDSTVDSFVDAIVNGGDVLKAAGKALRESLLEGFSNLAKEQLKTGVKSLVVAGAEKINPELAKQLGGADYAANRTADGIDSLKTDLPTALQTNATTVTDNATYNTDRLIQALQSMPVSTAGMQIPGIVPGAPAPMLPTLDSMIGKPYTSTETLDNPYALSKNYETSTKFFKEGIKYQPQQLDYLSVTADSTKSGVDATQSGFGKANWLTQNLTDTTVAGFASIATAIAAGRSTKSSILGGVLGIAGTVLGNMVAPGIGGMIGGQIGAMVGARADFANGGVMTSDGSMPLRMYANGGVARSPQLAMFGEGSKPEAYVPLPDGRSIPVTMQGSGGNVNNISVNVAVDNKGNAQTNTGGANSEEYTQKLGIAISNAVKSEISNQQRPGGLLYRGRR